ncbi:hypothetical protein PF005_g13972 [Phytophthora fragariae]|uniref:EF-hand domain-containing protein n=1 Tax=Phytophthora fragariae TaxID=53985 RepID=A0A6A3EN64_9STRA|nr:hypothetical protein PF003_g16690 [Phytophthora fragariae]KAE8934959.1 hypothetical protein PF009_g15072 [Phytophthora fragariae]KAE9104847.1 hypothetical protein PF007_g13907 [Phytophthora fragariae]KAE9141996.1 hypothetical protein PF006_g12856 [Phytophthora fragariae]KAE9203970.1 hypothetical protein PF005_g13972 [Phytophthora fragariae]
MAGAKIANTREDVKPESARSKTASVSVNSKTSRESDEVRMRAPETRKTKKKKARKDDSTTSNAGDNKTTRKKKPPKNREEHRVSDCTLEVHPVIQKKPSQRKVQVKQRSFTTLVDAGSSTIAVGDTTGTEAPVPAEDETGGFASGQYGVLLETKRTEKLCLSLALDKRHVGGMLRAFKREEQLGDGEITTATVATWSKSELLHYAFKQFDVDESGVMDGRELRAFCEGLKNDSSSSLYFAKNVNTAREKIAAREQNHLTRGFSGQLDIDANTVVDLGDLAKGSTEFQIAFYPLLQLQQNVRACALGERFWAEVAQRRQEVEVIVHYMRLNSGKLPSFSIMKRIVAYFMPFSHANAQLVARKLAVLKFAEEGRIWQDQSKARAEAEALTLKGIEEDDKDSSKP